MNLRRFFNFLAGKAAKCFSYVAFVNRNHLYSKSLISCNNGDSANENIANNVLSCVLPLRRENTTKNIIMLNYQLSYSAQSLDIWYEEVFFNVSESIRFLTYFMLRSLTFFEVMWLLLCYILHFEVFGPLTLLGNKKNFFPYILMQGSLHVLSFDINRLQTFKYFLACARVILGSLNASRAFSSSEYL